MLHVADWSLKHLQRKWTATLAERHQSTEVEAHEASIACNDNPLRLAVNIDQTGCGIRLQRRNRLLLLRRERSHGLDLLHQRSQYGADIVIEDGREVGVSVTRQQSLKRRRMGQGISRLPALNGPRQRADIGPGDQVTVDVGVVHFKIL